MLQGLKLYGLHNVCEVEGRFWRLPMEIIRKMPAGFEHYGKRGAGGRLRFKTDAEQITVKYTLSTEGVDGWMALPSASGMDVYFGTGVNAWFGGAAAPGGYGYKDKLIKGVIKRRKQAGRAERMENVTINLPRNDLLSSLEIETEPGALVEPPDEYTIRKPIVFYGSSITEGAHAPRPGTAYTSTLCRWLDADYFNYGFSGQALGEPVFAEFIASHKDISLFVYDYDHNAPTPEHLERTHEPFFKIIRKAHPSLPVIMITKPDFDPDPELNAKRRGIIYRTYINAVEQGDRNVYFVDGEGFYGFTGREECSSDGCHPNALGMMRMTEKLYPLARRILADR